QGFSDAVTIPRARTSFRKCWGLWIVVAFALPKLFRFRGSAWNWDGCLHRDPLTPAFPSATSEKTYSFCLQENTFRTTRPSDHRQAEKRWITFAQPRVCSACMKN